VTGLVCRLTVLAAAVACLAAIGALSIRGSLARLTLPAALVLVTLLAVTAVALADVALRRRAGLVRRVLAELGLLAMALLVVEAAAALFAPALPRTQITLVRRSAAARRGIPFDSRTTTEVVAALREQGIDALPGIARDWPLVYSLRPRLPAAFYPLSHASRATVVECNETGEYLVYRTDEFGFNNPPGLLASRRLDIVVVGESHALGHCLPGSQSLIGRLRNSVSRTATLGLAGTRTMGMLATFREYVEPLRPRLVLWMISPSFADDAEGVQDPVLIRYLDRAFSQHLLDRQPEVDRVVRGVAVPARAEYDRAVTEAMAHAHTERLLAIPTLSQLRLRLRPLMWQAFGSPDLTPFVQSVQLAASTTHAWGGDFAVVIAPMYEEVVARALPSALSHARLASLLAELGIPVIDPVPLFLAHADPAGLYTMRMNNHPTAEGYAFLTDYVVRELQRRFPQRLAALPQPAPPRTLR
jgi:hypothetical protein